MANRNPEGLVDVVETIGYDRNPMVIHLSVEGRYEVELRDGSPYGNGDSAPEAMYSLADRLDQLSKAIRTKAKDYG